MRDGIQELRIDVGSGYRVYYAFIGSNVVLLACGGNKRSQNRNITAAINMLQTGRYEMQKTDRYHEEATIEMFRNDPALATEYLNDVLATGDEVDLVLALRYLSNAFGGIQETARQANRSVVTTTYYLMA